MKVFIPSRETLDITHVVLDMNGTIALDGGLLEGVAERLEELSRSVRVVMLTADTHGGAAELGERLAIETHILAAGSQAEQKLEFVRGLGPKHTIAVGNGSNDALMLAGSGVGIAVIGSEGASLEALHAADVVVTDIRDALDLLLKPQRLAATLRR
jgi:P-type E1-E2 ATPase